ncbi:MAG: NADPH-dependent 7-cyano-7-deazaguanine reductase QueF [Xanthomonadales bacterium]|nr:NADPH-dependent 7-cyano-7-deazaguanine reductase QueF [Xanthomonadales bacterium]
MGRLDESALGKTTTYRDRYDPGLLLPLPRAQQRALLGVGVPLPFHGVDIWNAYELSWLNQRGQPRVAMAEFRVPATSPNLIESKSFKLYLNGYAQERIDGQAALAAILTRDLSAAAGAEVAVALHAADVPGAPAGVLAGISLDAQDLAIDCYGPPRPEYLCTAADATPISETLVSHLLRSNCPVTGQPDWGSVQIGYVGPPIDHAGLLRYIVSFRKHNEFHEHCVERMFVDLMQRCAPRELSVHARYTRRGGLDINPFRSTSGAPPENLRTPRQ